MLATSKPDTRRIGFPDEPTFHDWLSHDCDIVLLGAIEYGEPDGHQYAISFEATLTFSFIIGFSVNSWSNQVMT